MLNAKFTQFRGTRDAESVGKGKRRASLFEHGNHDRHTLLFPDTKTIPPDLKIHGDDDLGGHTRSIPYQDYSVKGLYLNLAASCGKLYAVDQHPIRTEASPYPS